MLVVRGEEMELPGSEGQREVVEESPAEGVMEHGRLPDSMVRRPWECALCMVPRQQRWMLVPCNFRPDCLESAVEVEYSWVKVFVLRAKSMS
jgi:hypothetical protein